MFSNTLGIIVFFILAITWMIYLVQESFLSGVAILSNSIAKDETDRKKMQIISGLHFDGIEVWLIAAIALTEGAFPLAFGRVFSYLYVVLFLLLFAIIFRGLSVSEMYKLDDPRWQKAMKVTWIVSSTLMVFLLGVYISNQFLGFPGDASGLSGTGFEVLNVTGISGGLLFVAIAMVSGAGWTYLLTDGSLQERALSFVKKTGVIYAVPVLTLLVFMGLNTGTQSSVWTGELYLKYPFLYLLPFLTVLFGIFVIIYGYKQNGKRLFLSSLLVMAFFVLSGFLGVFPNVVSSSTNPDFSLSLFDAMSSSYGLTIVVIAVGVFYPLILWYQTWKYKKFFHTVKTEVKE